MSFASLGLAEPIVRAVTEHGYTEPTPIQTQAIPAVLSGGDLLAGAQTGTGKTAGFVLPILHRLTATPAPQAVNGRAPVRTLILTPTRELAAQVEESVRTYGAHVPLTSMVMFGGVGMQPQVDRLKQRVDILVATPGRLLDHVQQKTLDLSAVEILVLDEADRMLDMGFIRDIRRVLALLPKKRQNLLFSATFSDEIRTLAHDLLDNPATIEVARRNAPTELVDQKVIAVEKGAKRALLSHVIRTQKWFQVLVFTRTKHGANRLAEQLTKDGIPSLAIHGNKSQSARTRALAEFKAGTLQVLVATDIAARGLDIVELPHVVNYELPNVPEDYVHRIGRTGRAGATGEAVALVSSEEKSLLTDIERLIKRTLPRTTVEGFDMAAALAASRTPEARAAEERPPLQRRGAPRPEGTRTGGGGQRTGGQPRGDGQPRRAAQPRADAQPRDPNAQPRRDAQPRGDGQSRRGGQPRGDAQPRGDGQLRRGGQPRGDAQPRDPNAQPRRVQGEANGNGPARRARAEAPRKVWPRDENGEINGNVMPPQRHVDVDIDDLINGNVMPPPPPPEPNGNVMPRHTQGNRDGNTQRGGAQQPGQSRNRNGQPGRNPRNAGNDQPRRSGNAAPRQEQGRQPKQPPAAAPAQQPRDPQGAQDKPRSGIKGAIASAIGVFRKFG